VRPDYAKIAWLEYELGFSDEKPPGGPQSLAAVDSILKAAWTQPICDRPGQVIFYDPRDGIPKYEAS
jgi:hypothetical protein